MSNLPICLHSFVSELISAGVKHVVVNPGSRNFPLIKTLVAGKKFIQLHSTVDERSAAFFALGLAQSTDTPVVLCCTSGTAGLNYYPGIAEAFYSETPLIVLTADRPPESIDNWEGQCIRQQNLFEQHTLLSCQTPANTFKPTEFASIARQAAQTANGLRGPVHVNIPIREPFYNDWVLPKFQPITKPVGQEKPVAMPTEFIEQLKVVGKVLWLNGANSTGESHNYPPNLPVFSDVISNQPNVIPLWESLLMQDVEKEGALLPEMIITTGKYMVSKRLRSFLKHAKNLIHWHIGPKEAIPTPFGTNPNCFNGRVDLVLNVLSEIGISAAYKQAIEHRCHKIEKKIQSMDWDDYNEFGLLKRLYKALPESAVLCMSNSMPVRYVGLLPRRESIEHQANRGTSGIDGCTSTAVGFAKGCENPVFLFTGDLAFFYDVNGLWHEHLPQNIKIVVFNNHGGGIFELIDGPNNHPEVLPWQTTDHSYSAKHIAQHFGLDYIQIETQDKVASQMETFFSSTKPTILEISTQRVDNNRFYNHYINSIKKAL